MQNITVRKAILNDRIAIYDWFNNQLYKPFISDSESLLSYDNYCNWFDQTVNSDLLYIGVIDNLRFGLVWVFGGKESEIEVLVKPSYCGKKITAYFIKAVLSLLKNEGKTSVLWQSTDNKTYYTKLFEDIGFIEVNNDEDIKLVYDL